MKLIRMYLENFKGIKKAEFNFGGYDANIYGANGTGKTTVFDAFTWLLFGKASEERANFSPKTITAEGVAHNLDHSVECDIEIDGTTTTFRRVFHEVYKKTRGSAESILSGHTTDYYINGVPKKEKEYQEFWKNIFGSDEKVKLLTMPAYFAEQLHWENRLAILFEICGNISDSEIMETDTELRELSLLMGNNSVAEYKKIVKAKQSTVKKRLDLLPARIDEATKAIPDKLPTDSKESMEHRAADIRKAISEAEKERASIIAGNDKEAHTRTEIAEKNAALSEARARYSERQREATDAALEKVQEIREKLAVEENELSQNTRTLEQSKQRVADIEKKREQIMTSHKEKQVEYAEVEREQFDETSAVCDKCGQALPESRVLDLKSLFNERKSNRLTALTEAMNGLIAEGKAKASKEMLAAEQQMVANLEAAVANKKEMIANLNSCLDEYKKGVEASKLPPFETTDEYKQITAAIDELKSRECEAPRTDSIDARIADLRAEEATITASIAALETKTVQEARISELEQEQKSLGVQLGEAERSMYLCEKFTRVKSALLNDKFHEHFKTVKFQLFKQNTSNDGIEDICDVLVPTATGAFVPFSDANKAARLNAGIEIIGVLGEHYGVELPIFVDNAESVTHIIPTKGQLIRLVVSESDNELRLETL
jgi:DNA repair exonuclease SbcCD ATPase subunit|nr:MAG TPA: chromosome partition protein [Caudoviricetes sp.]